MLNSEDFSDDFCDNTQDRCLYYAPTYRLKRHPFWHYLYQQCNWLWKHSFRCLNRALIWHYRFKALGLVRLGRLFAYALIWESRITQWIWNLIRRPLHKKARPTIIENEFR